MSAATAPSQALVDAQVESAKREVERLKAILAGTGR